MAKVYIAAHEFRHAEYYARNFLHIGRSSWEFIDDHYRLQGLSQCEVLIVEAPRHEPTSRQLELRCIINEVCEARRLTVKRVSIP